MSSSSGHAAKHDSWIALRSPNFRQYLVVQGVSLAGSFMQQVALAWLAYSITHSPAALGTLAFTTDAASVLVTLFGGVLADRTDPRSIVVTTQSLAAAQAFLLAGLAAYTHMHFGWLLLLGAAFGLINGIDVPARQVLLLQLVGSEALGSAIVLLSVCLDGARLVGPALAGIMVATMGEYVCFLANGASYLPVIFSLIRMPLKHLRHPPDQESMLTRLGHGFSHANKTPRIRSILLLVALVSFAGGPYTMLMPVMATHALHGDANTLGLLMASIGIGALAGAWFLGRRADTADLRPWIGVGATIFGSSLVVFALSRALPLAIMALAFAGFGIMMTMASSHATLLRETGEEMRGRIMSLFSLSFMAAVPIGSIIAGSVANFTGAPVVLVAGGCTSCAIGVLYLAHTKTPRSIKAGMF